MYNVTGSYSPARFREIVASGYGTPEMRLFDSHSHRRVDTCHVTDYNHSVIRTFADAPTRDLYSTGKSKRFRPDIKRRALRKLEYVDLATGLQDLKVPPSNRLHELSGDRKGQFSISVNDQWRICFRFEDGDAFDVQLTDYH